MFDFMQKNNLSHPYYAMPDSKKNFVIAAKGSGVNNCYVNPILHDADGNTSFIITIPDKEIYLANKPLLTAKGYDVKLMDLVDLKNSPLKYDPFLHTEGISEIMDMIDVFIRNTNEISSDNCRDTFWDNLEKYFLCAVSAYANDSTLYNSLSGKRGFTAVNEVIKEIGSDKPMDRFHEIFSDIKRKDPKHPAVYFYNKLRVDDRSLRAAIISVAIRMSIFNVDKVADFISNDNIKMEDISNEKTAIFILTPISDTLLRFVSAMFLSQIMKYQVKNRQQAPKYPIHFVLNDPITFGVINDLPTYMELLGNSRMDIITQHKSHFERIYGRKITEKIISICDSIILMGSTETEDLAIFEGYVSKNKKLKKHFDQMTIEECCILKQNKTPEEVFLTKKIQRLEKNS